MDVTTALAGLATEEGTRRYAAAHAAVPGHYRTAHGLTVSSLGLGSYLGDVGPEANRAYEEAALAALGAGVNVLDTAINYRHQQSERDLGRALARWGRRDEVVVATKGGFLPLDAEARGPAAAYWRREFFETGVLRPADIAGGVHAMAPAFVRDQLGRSLRNLGLAGVDVYFLHNPETQLQAGASRPDFEARLGAAFETLERECDAGRVWVYGLATWDGFRVPPSAPTHLSLERALAIAADARAAVGGAASGHHVGAVELPVNLAMNEAAASPTQRWRGRLVPLLDAAAEAGLLVLASASLLQGRLLGRIPASVREGLGAADDVGAAIQFSRSAPGVTTALVGMGDPAHARSNGGAAARAPPVPEAVRALLGAAAPAAESSAGR